MHDGELPDVDFIIANQGHNIYYKGKLWDPWIRYMDSVNFLLSSVAHTADVLRHLDVTPCSIQIEHHDFFLRWWVKGGSSWNECANIYHRVCDSVPAFPSSRLYKYTQEEIATEFADNNWFEEYGMGCQLQSALIRDSKAPAAQFLYDHISRYCPRRPLAMWAGDGDNDIGMLDIFFGNCAIQCLLWLEEGLLPIRSHWTHFCSFFKCCSGSDRRSATFCRSALRLGSKGTMLIKIIAFSMQSAPCPMLHTFLQII